MDLALLWARCDSRPELKAKEPRGRAESESKRRACREGFILSLVDEAQSRS